MRMSVFSARSWSDAAARHHSNAVCSGLFQPSQEMSSLAFGLDNPRVAVDGIDGRFELTVMLSSLEYVVGGVGERGVTTR